MFQKNAPILVYPRLTSIKQSSTARALRRRIVLRRDFAAIGIIERQRARVAHAGPSRIFVRRGEALLGFLAFVLFRLRSGAFLEQLLGGDGGFLGRRLLRQNVLAARLALGFVLGARDVERHLHADFG